MEQPLDEQEIDRLAGELANLTGETSLEAVKTSLRKRLHREHLRRGPVGLWEQLMALGAEFAALPTYDARTPDEICGYDETGMWS